MRRAAQCEQERRCAFPLGLGWRDAPLMSGPCTPGASLSSPGLDTQGEHARAGQCTTRTGPQAVPAHRSARRPMVATGGRIAFPSDEETGSSYAVRRSRSPPGADRLSRR